MVLHPLRNNIMRKLITIILLLCAGIAQAQTPYRLNYDNIIIGNPEGTGNTSLFGTVDLKNVSLGLVSDSMLVVRNGRIFKVLKTNGTVTSVSGTSPISVATGTTTPVISMTAASAANEGYMTIGAQTIAGIKTYNTGSGYAGYFNKTISTGAILGLQILGVDKSFIEWNVNDGGSAVGTAMNLRNNQGAIGVYDNTNTGLKISGGNAVFGGTVTAPTFIGALTGVASSATILATTRTIWGQNFNGSANVTGALTGVTGITSTGDFSNTSTMFNRGQVAFGTYDGGVDVPAESGYALTLGGSTSLYTHGSIYSIPQGTLYGTATGSITSAQLATSLTNETGTGVAVFSTSPTLVTPILGNATGGTLGLGGNLTLTGLNSANNTDQTQVKWIDLGGNQLGRIIGRRGTDGNQGILKLYTANADVLSQTWNADGSVTLSQALTGTSATFSSALGLTINNGVGVSKSAYQLYTGTTAASATQNWYAGINVFATNGSYEIKDGGGTVGLTIAPSGAISLSGALTGTSATFTTGVNMATASGYVGIGTASPAAILHLKSTTNLVSIIDRPADTNFGVLSYFTAGAERWVVGLRTTAAAGADAFSIYSIGLGANAMTILANGNVGIGTTSPATSGLLDLTSTTGALILTRMTTTQRNAMTAVNGMLIYNTTTATIQGYQGGAWTNL